MRGIRACPSVDRAMVRSAAAFGVDLVLLGPACCDAWYRRAVRCSMGHVFRVPVHRCAALPEALRRLEEGFGVAAFAAVIDAEAPALGGLRSVPARWCVGPELFPLFAGSLRVWRACFPHSFCDDSGKWVALRCFHMAAVLLFQVPRRWQRAGRHLGGGARCLRRRGRAH